MIFCPRTIIYQPTVDALDGLGRPWTPVDLTADYGYVDYWRERWRERQDFVNIEHDTLVTPEQVDEIEGCPEEWCSFDAGPVAGDGQYSLNLARFRTSFMDRYPEIWEGYWTQRLAGEVPHALFMAPDWYYCDTWLLYRTRRTPHTHAPPVKNARPPGSSWEADTRLITQLVLDSMADPSPLVLTPRAPIVANAPTP